MGCKVDRNGKREVEEGRKGGDVNWTRKGRRKWKRSENW